MFVIRSLQTQPSRRTAATIAIAANARAFLRVPRSEDKPSAGESTRAATDCSSVDALLDPFESLPARTLCAGLRLGELGASVRR